MLADRQDGEGEGGKEATKKKRMQGRSLTWCAAPAANLNAGITSNEADKAALAAACRSYYSDDRVCDSNTEDVS